MHLLWLRMTWALHLIASYCAAVDAASPGRFSKPQLKCPQSCSEAGAPSNWTTYHDHHRLDLCNQTTVLEFNVFNSLADPSTHQSIRACSAEELNPTDTPTCPGFSGITLSAAVDSVQQSTAVVDDTEAAVAAAEGILSYLTSTQAACNTTTLFAHSGDTAVGVFIGGFISTPGMASTVLKNFIVDLESGGEPLVQLCNESIAGSDFTIGIVASDDPDLSIVQKSVAKWASGGCVAGTTQAWRDFTIPVLAAPGVATSDTATASSNATSLITISTAARTRRRNDVSLRQDGLSSRGDTCSTVTVASGDSCSSLVTECGITSTEFYEYNTDSDLCSTLAVGQVLCCSSGSLPGSQANADGTCTTVEVVSGDSCATLVTECGISSTQFTEYNNATDLCSTLAAGQHVCCTAGTMPDFAPQPNSDGSCSTYTVASGDSCSALAAEYSLTNAKIESFNNNTWGFLGCSDLQIGQVICLSSGSPPFPASLANAECGPQVPGTIAPADTYNISWMNPCPLNVCCDMWGQCGSQPDYCTASSADSGAPGTAATGENGCISNCGLDIVVGDAPDSKYTVGYYEAFAVERDCLVMEAEDIPTDKYTHVHFGYANITDEFALQLEGAVAAQWAHFATMSEIKRILSFGGWAASTDADTYTIFRDMVKEENRATFIKHLVTFTLDYDVDGFDFDWEYPGEPDIPGIPAGSDDEGTNYLAFLTELRAALDDDITISIAAPASYWYLQSFPIANISKVVDYIVYMTYDLHGQWDYGNAYADTGCDNGDCLRSHVNMTETMWALSMVTKAGVPTNKIVVGVSSYARSFGMTDSSCTGPMCTYEGPDSTAIPGECTATAGYLANAEILSIVTTEGTNATMAYDSKSRSNIVYYNNTWMAYMDSTEKAARTKNYTAYNFLGTVEWAIDLEEFIDDVDDSQDVWDCPDADLFTDLDSISANSSVPDDCLNYYVLSVMAANMTASLQAYTDLMNDDYEEKFKYYAKAVKSAAPDQWTSFYKNEYDNLTTCEWLGPKDGSPDSTEYLNQTGGCPPNDEPTFVTKNEVEVGFTLYTLFPNKTEFEDVAAGTYGLDVDWINYDAYTLKQQYCKVTDPIGKTIGECSEGQVPIWHQPELYDSLTVDDPSDIITSSLPNYQNVSNWLNDIVMDMSAGCFTANDVDAIDAMSVSVYTVDAAIAQMQQVSEVGEEVEEAEKKALEENLIFFFVSALLLLIPGLGEGLDAILDTTFLARMATLIGDVGDAALTLYSVYEDPDSAPIAIAGLLIGGAISREDSIFASAAKLRRAMSADDVAALGARAETNLKKIENMKQTCRV